MSLLSAHKAWFWFQHDDDKCSSRRSTRNHSGLHLHRPVSLVVLLVGTRLILQEGLLELLLVLGGPLSRWMFSEPDLLQIASLIHLRLGIQFFHQFWARSLPSHWVSKRGFLMRPFLSNSSMSATIRSPFQIPLPRTIHIGGIFLAILSSRTGGVSIGLLQKWCDIQPTSQMELSVTSMVHRSAFRKVFSHQTRDLECFADSSNTVWNPPTIFRPGLTATVLWGSLLNPAYRSLSIPVSFWTVRCRRTMIPR